MVGEIPIFTICLAATCLALLCFNEIDRRK